jgi:hypothetical protein
MCGWRLRVGVDADAILLKALRTAKVNPSFNLEQQMRQESPIAPKIK